MLQGGKNEVSHKKKQMEKAEEPFNLIYGYTGTAAGMCAEIAR